MAIFSFKRKGAIAPSFCRAIALYTTSNNTRIPAKSPTYPRSQGSL
ncbi:MAG TPA: hypothetical protein V6D33_01320 [Cyanophyceae cyanobacterium]